MRFTSLLLVLSIVAASTTLSQAAPVQKIVPMGTTSFTSKSQHFSIWLPVAPVQRQQTVHLKNGKKGNVFIFLTDRNGVSYLVVSASTAGSSTTAQGGLDDAQRNFLRSSGAELQKRQDIQLDGFPGRELTVKSFIGRPVRTRMYQTPRFFYQIVAQGEKEPMQKQSKQIDRFLGSFRILP